MASDSHDAGFDSIASLRKSPSVVQALYHAATGKTENLTKRLAKNYIIRKNDIDQLYHKLKQQLDQYEIVAGPTVTILVKFQNKENHQFSSWERFQIFDSGKHELVDDVIIKLEFVVRIPSTPEPQRYIVTVDIDSRLAVVEQAMQSKFILIYIEDLPSIVASVDYIDYVCAKNFIQTIEDWFDSLEESPNSRLLQLLRRSDIPYKDIFLAVGNLSAAAFIGVFGYLKVDDFPGFKQISYFIAVTIVVWTITQLICRYLSNRFEDILLRSFVPPIIVLTKGDERAFARSCERNSKTVPKLVFSAASALVTGALNLLVGYLYAWFTG